VANLSQRERVPGARADLNIQGSLPAKFFDCVILTQVLHFPSPETALANLWASITPGGVLLLTVPSLDRLDPHDHGTDFWRRTPNGLAEVLHAEELDFADPRFPLVACAHAEKAWRRAGPPTSGIRSPV
jgi:SAM-dependent methyltransferase